MAGAELRISAAWRISLADSTYGMCQRTRLSLGAFPVDTYLCLGGNDLTLSNTLALGSH
jgi:hypothetical protein